MLIDKELHEQDLHKLKEWMSGHDNEVVSAICRLYEYIEMSDLSLSQFTQESWEDYFSWAVTSTSNIFAVKTRIKDFLVANDYPQSVVTSLETMNKSGGTNYILNFDYLHQIILDYRAEKIGMSFRQMGKCDSLSSIEICIYLIWLGFSLDEALKIQTCDINYSSCEIKYNDKCVKVPKLIFSKIEQYVSASGFYYDNGIHINPSYKEYEREDNLLICKGKCGYKKAAMEKYIIKMGLTVQYIWMSGRFYSAWQKSLNDSVPSFSWENKSQVEQFMGFGNDYNIMSKNQMVILKYDWEQYCSQQNDDKLGIKIDEQHSRQRNKKISEFSKKST